MTRKSNQGLWWAAVVVLSAIVIGVAYFGTRLPEGSVQGHASTGERLGASQAGPQRRAFYADASTAAGRAARRGGRRQVQSLV